MVQVPSAASDRGKRRSASSAAACASASVTPASQIITSARGSISRMRFNRRVERMISSPVSSGVWPPTRPVLPPCGVTPKPRLVAKARTFGDLGGRSGTNEGERLALEEAARLHELAGEQLADRSARGPRRRCSSKAFDGGLAFNLHPRSLRARGFARGRRKTAASSTWGEKRNWSTGHDRPEEEPGVDQDAGVPGEGRGVAGNGDDKGWTPLAARARACASGAGAGRIEQRRRRRQTIRRRESGRRKRLRVSAVDRPEARRLCSRGAQSATDGRGVRVGGVDFVSAGETQGEGAGAAEEVRDLLRAP